MCRLHKTVEGVTLQVRGNVQGFPQLYVMSPWKNGDPMIDKKSSEKELCIGKGHKQF